MIQVHPVFIVMFFVLGVSLSTIFWCIILSQVNKRLRLITDHYINTVTRERELSTRLEQYRRYHQ